MSNTENRNFENRLAKEKSPYLLQHKNNPVDWYPWSEEAFEKSLKENKPIFLSIGYSTCHWCHVMEYESFENIEIAKILNRNFIAIKVDREERPDIDNIYMLAVMAMTGRGGWPLTVFLTSDKKPFFGGTYFPPESKWGTPGLINVLDSVYSKWQNNKKEIIQSSQEITDLIAKNARNDFGRSVLNEDIMDQTQELFLSKFDRDYGGFGSSPKFPSSHNLSFLLRHWYQTGNEDSLMMVKKTLLNIGNGGIYDHIGGGFHRYATDRYWQIPHFEKMLYDQAILTRTYAEAYQITKDEQYLRIIRETFDYVLRDMQSEEGGFYSAEDADSLDPDDYGQMSFEEQFGKEKKEGSFYLWRYDEIKNILNEEEFEVFSHYYGIRKGGNAHTDPHKEFIDKNIIFAITTVENLAKKWNKGKEEIYKILDGSRRKVFQHRLKRPRPSLDDKILVDWNGLMIGSLAFGGRVLEDERYIEAAEKAADFILKNLKDKDGHLFHRYRLNDVAVEGSIEDYSFFILGLLDLYQVTQKIKYLEEADFLKGVMMELFWDDDQGGFYFTSSSQDVLLFKHKEIYDGAIPSGNSVAAHVLVRLMYLKQDTGIDKLLEKMFGNFANKINEYPIGYTSMLSAFDFIRGKGIEIVLAEVGTDLSQKVQDYVGRTYLPNHVMMIRRDKELDRLLKIAPFVERQVPIDNRSTVYICEDYFCQLPVNSMEKFKFRMKSFVRKSY